MPKISARCSLVTFLLRFRTHKRLGGGVAFLGGVARRSFDLERLSRARSRLPLRPRRLGETDERLFGERELRRLGDGEPRRLGEGEPRRRGDGEPRRRGEGEPRLFGLPVLRRFGDGELRRLGEGDIRRRRRSGVGDRRDEATVAFSPRSARAPRGEEERRVGLLPRSFADEIFFW